MGNKNIILAFAEHTHEPLHAADGSQSACNIRLALVPCQVLVTVRSAQPTNYHFITRAVIEIERERLRSGRRGTERTRSRSPINAPLRSSVGVYIMKIAEQHMARRGRSLEFHGYVIFRIHQHRNLIRQSVWFINSLLPKSATI